MTLYKWSQTAATNASIDSTVNWAEGQPPSSVNDSARGMMAATAKARDDWSGKLVTGGSADTLTLTTNQGTTVLLDGFSVTAQIGTTTGEDPTLNVDATGARDIMTSDGVNVPESALLANSTHTFTYSSADDCWYVHGYFSIVAVTGAALDIHGTTELTAPAVDDELIIYDLSATANRRITLTNFMSVINGLTAETGIALDDYFPFYDTSEPLANKITPVDLLKVLNLLTEDAAPDINADFFLSYDASANTVKKVKPANSNNNTMVLLQTQVASSSSQLDFALDTDYENFELTWHGVAPDFGEWLFMRFSQNGGSSYLSGGSDYSYQWITNAGSVTDNSESFIPLMIDAPAGANESTSGRVTMFGLTTTSFRKHISGQMMRFTGQNNAHSLAAQFNANNNAVTHIRLLMGTTAVIAAGTFSLYGIKT